MRIDPAGWPFILGGLAVALLSWLTGGPIFGLIFGVLTEKISWSVAFKTAVFMPMAISLFAAGVIWRIMDQKEPERGTVNAMIGVVADYVNPPGALPSAFPATPALTGSETEGYTLRTPVPTGGTAQLPLTGIPPEDVSAFERALEEAGVKHELVTYPGAPHSFFDRKYEDFAADSEDAWNRVLSFIRRYS